MNIAIKAQDFRRFEVAPLSPAIGAELLGIDLANIDDDLIGEVRTALLTYKVVFFRDQTISRADHIAFARAFGELEIHPATPKGQPDPEVLRIAHGPGSRGQENFWHSDVTWRAEPSLGSILRAIELPDIGGDTLFANMNLAYEALPDDLKLEICEMNAVHDIARVFAGRLSKEASKLHEQFPPQTHPLVRTHPETGERILYVNTAFTSHIEGMDADKSAALLKRLYATASRPEIQCRFRWAPGSLAFWDNRICQHYAASDYFPAVRVMERATIAGDRPFFDAAA